MQPRTTAGSVPLAGIGVVGAEVLGSVDVVESVDVVGSVDEVESVDVLGSPAEIETAVDVVDVDVVDVVVKAGSIAGSDLEADTSGAHTVDAATGLDPAAS